MSFVKYINTFFNALTVASHWSDPPNFDREYEVVIYNAAAILTFLALKFP